MKADILIVGAGFCGATLAERLASKLNKKVIIIDRRQHLGGNAYDHLDEKGVLVHEYGPHIFHTASEKVFHYLSQFTQWRPYEHKVLSYVLGKFLPFPINRKTLNLLYQLNLSSENDVELYLQSKRMAIPNPSNAEEKVLSEVGQHLYELFFKDYTRKQWGIDPKELSPTVTGRIPVRLNEDCRYFTDAYQYLPLDGYTSLFQKLLRHPKITVLRGKTYEELSSDIQFDHLIYTGSIDEYFGYCYGRLPYRSMHFEFKHYQKLRMQETATINYPDLRPYTRVTEFKQMTGQNCKGTTLCYEYPKQADDVMERYYPIPTRENEELYRKYVKKAKKLSHVTFCGRLGDYKYYNMDHAVMRAFNVFEQKFCR